MKIKINHNYSESTELEIEAVEPYTVQEVLDLLNQNRAWTTPLCDRNSLYRSYVQTVVGEESITIAHMLQTNSDFSDKWEIANDSQSATE